MTIIIYTHPTKKTVTRQYKSDTWKGHIPTDIRMHNEGYKKTRIVIPTEVINFLENYKKPLDK